MPDVPYLDVDMTVGAQGGPHHASTLGCAPCLNAISVTDPAVAAGPIASTLGCASWLNAVLVMDVQGR